MNDAIVGFIGFGLIGGSIARALKEINPGNKLIAFNYNKNKISGGLKEAYDDKILDTIVFDLRDGFPECDIIFLCAPVLSNIAYLSQLKDVIKEDCILTDVGSVKGNIHAEVDKLGLSGNFIGGHPMAGSEKTGYGSSSSRLLENAYYILTPTPLSPIDKRDMLYNLVKDMGGIPLLLNPEEHDDITAAISHVPHIIASGLVKMVKTSDDSEGKMRTLAAGGFKDITRIASSSAVMWQNICLTNTDSIKRFLRLYMDGLMEVYEALEKKEENYLYDYFSEASDYRDSIPNRSMGLMKKTFEIYMDIADETGSIATIATLLANNIISIKNIGIIHNREFEQGVLRIEFYEEEPLKRAVTLLKDYQYRVFER